MSRRSDRRGLGGMCGLELNVADKSCDQVRQLEVYIGDLFSNISNQLRLQEKANTLQRQLAQQGNTLQRQLAQQGNTLQW